MYNILFRCNQLYIIIQLSYIMEDNLNQTITFLGSSNSELSRTNNFLLSTESLISELNDSSHRLILDGQLNMERVLVSTMSQCANKCITSFKIEKITKSEETCLQSCHYKYLNTISSGLGIMNAYLKERSNI